MKTILATAITCALGCFAYSPSAEAATETVLYSFCSQQNCADGEEPSSSVVFANGMLYGTTVIGGNEGCAFGCGTLFSLDVNTGTETVLHSFPVNSTDGYFPSGNLMNVNGTLYGTTSEGGAYGYYGSYRGTLYSFNIANNTETVLYSFCSKKECKDGAYPTGGLIVRDNFYGTTLLGGKIREGGELGGAFYSLNLETGIEKVRHTFPYESKNGYTPEEKLIDVEGALYGVTYEGGAGTCYGTGFDGCGTVFSLDPKSGAETVLHSFSNGSTDGAFPLAGLIKVGNELYGTTSFGGLGNCFTQEGATGCGTVFSLDPKTGVEKVLHFFCSQQNCADGAEPVANLIKVNGLLYGTTEGGGAYRDGTVFSIDPTTGMEAVVYSFCSQQNCTDGRLPAAGLISVNGTLYGTTEFGGGHDEGTVFSIVP